jgi:uncharacterized membrane protein YtjA (UPF0391 family)
MPASFHFPQRTRPSGFPRNDPAVRHHFCYSALLNKHPPRERVSGGEMLYYALIFLVLGLIAGALGVSGVAAVATQIAYVLFVIAVVLFVVHLITGRRTLAP